MLYRETCICDRKVAPVAGFMSKKLEPISQQKFDKVIKRFKKSEDMRDELWYKCMNLLNYDNKKFEVEAYILLLATWDFSYFRFVMIEMKLDKFREILKEVNPFFDRLHGCKFMEVDFSSSELQNKIKFIYEKLRYYNAVKQTGATKIMALRNPDFFVMWDTEIRKHYGINDRTTASDYISFLIGMQGKFKNLKRCTPKSIDEYNYIVTQSKAKLLKSSHKAPKGI